MNEVAIIPVSGLPEVLPGDNLADLTHNVLKKLNRKVMDGDIFVVTQKIVSKSEGMSRDLDEYNFEDLLMGEVNRVIRRRGELIIAKTKHGFICANAGIDKSNVKKNTVLLLPEDPNKSAHSYRKKMESLTGKKIAVIVSDTFGRAWRKGQVNFAIGSSGINPVTSYIGKTDTYENELNATEIAVIDEIASAAELVMEKTINVPIAIVRGVKYEDSKKNASALIREDEEDFFL